MSARKEIVIGDSEFSKVDDCFPQPERIFLKYKFYTDDIGSSRLSLSCKGWTRYFNEPSVLKNPENLVGFGLLPGLLYGVLSAISFKYNTVSPEEYLFNRRRVELDWAVLEPVCDEVPF